MTQYFNCHYDFLSTFFMNYLAARLSNVFCIPLSNVLVMFVSSIGLKVVVSNIKEIHVGSRMSIFMFPLLYGHVKNNPTVYLFLILISLDMLPTGE